MTDALTAAEKLEAWSKLDGTWYANVGRKTAADMCKTFAEVAALLRQSASVPSDDVVENALSAFYGADWKTECDDFVVTARIDRMRSALRAAGIAGPVTVTHEMVGAASKAHQEEWGRWIGRSNWKPDQYEVCRFDDSGNAGSFSEIHAFQSSAEAGEALASMRAERSMGAALAAALSLPREPAQGEREEILAGLRDDAAWAERTSVELPDDQIALASGLELVRRRSLAAASFITALRTPQPVSGERGVMISMEMLNFLQGIGPLDGIHFGDDERRHKKGRFWWRKYLPAAPQTGETK